MPPALSLDEWEDLDVDPVFALAAVDSGPRKKVAMLLIPSFVL